MADKNNNPFNEWDDLLRSINAKLDFLSQRLNVKEDQEERKKLLDSMPDELSSKHLKLLFGKSAVTIWNWENKRLLNPNRINGQKYYHKQDILKLLNERG